MVQSNCNTQIVRFDKELLRYFSSSYNIDFIFNLHWCSFVYYLFYN